MRNESDVDAYMLLNRGIDVAARCALGDGLTREEVAQALNTLAAAIADPSSVAEDMSPITVRVA